MISRAAVICIGLTLLACAFAYASNDPAASVSIDRQAQSVLVKTKDRAVRVRPWSAGSVRVEVSPAAAIPAKESLVVTMLPDASGWTVEEKPGSVIVKGPRMSASVDTGTGLVSVLAADGKVLLQQADTVFQPAQDAARDGLSIKASFRRFPDEHFYGGGVIGADLRKPTAEIRFTQNNTEIRVPVLYSSRGYGMLWDNSGRGQLRLRPDFFAWDAAAGDLADFYVMAGPSADEAVAEYRQLTGTAPLFPKWAYGFWFSKNKFNSQKEILDAAASFREHRFPVDLLVQDYFFWKPDGGSSGWTNWGSHHFAESRYPSPAQMVERLHNEFHIQFMSVIWAKFDPETAHSKELEKAGGLFPPHKDGHGDPLRYYDPFNAKAREIYGRQVMESLLSLGQDAFWMDGAEPEIPNHVFAKFDSPLGPVSRLMNAFPLVHTGAVYDAQRAATDKNRVVLLPRSAWAGMQRYAAANWTGDIRQDWKALAWQIEGLQNYSITGMPYITTDVGGYAPTAESDRELFVRWSQWGAFCPIYRAHGIGRPFPWQYGSEGEAILRKYTMLRYRLLPYIYSEAAAVTQRQSTLMRPLVMDFQDDPQALGTWDEFLFGPSLLVCPVYQSRLVLAATPEQWADAGGQAGGVSATFLRAGSEAAAPVRKELDGSFVFRGQPSRDESSSKGVRIEGAFTPRQDGNFALHLTSISSPSAEATVTIDGKSVAPDSTGGDWQFPLYPFQGKTGTPVRFLIESKVNKPGLRIVSAPDKAQFRNVYLPGKQAWWDFWTGERVNAGQTLKVETPLDHMPLYVRAGAIIPMGPEVQYATEKPGAPIELRVYRGADGSFTLYDDEADNYNYEKGRFSKTTITWNDAAQTLTFSQREGSYEGMPATSTFRIVWVRKNHGTGGDVSSSVDREVSYDGHELVVKVPAGL